jgi:hypothetical protein
VDTCAVCGEPVDEENSAVCQGCDRRYHLVLRQGQPGKDCGEVWVDELSMSLRFACSNCLPKPVAGSPAAGAASRPVPPRRVPKTRRSQSPRRYRKR